MPIFFHKNQINLFVWKTVTLMGLAYDAKMFRVYLVENSSKPCKIVSY